MSDNILQENGSAILKEQGGRMSSSDGYFAEVIGGVVQRVIVAYKDFIDSGAVGNPANWVETKLDGSIRGKYAEKGDSYNGSEFTHN